MQFCTFYGVSLSFFFSFFFVLEGDMIFRLPYNKFALQACIEEKMRKPKNNHGNHRNPVSKFLVKNDIVLILRCMTLSVNAIPISLWPFSDLNEAI